MRKLKVGIIGATGIVGQRIVTLLEDHPWFEISWLAASENNIGKVYSEAVRWALPRRIPENASDMILEKSEPGSSADIVFSASSAPDIGAIEQIFAKAGYVVVSNAAAHRMDPLVPLIIPEINASHLSLIQAQKNAKGFDKGFIVTNPNCSTIPLAAVAAPLHREWGIDSMSVVTLQAVSGAGYPGVPSIDMIDNLIPFIPNEEQKIEAESLKLLGRYVDNSIIEANCRVSASCHRVSVRDGHQLTVSFALNKQVHPDYVIKLLKKFQVADDIAALPTSPEHFFIVRDEDDRPQPHLDRDEGRGMSIVVGRIRACPAATVKMSILSHNTIRGAAGAAIQNAELLVMRGLV